MKVSYTLLTRNRSNDLQDALASITSQLYDNLEVIIVDNASTDDTKAVVQHRLAGVPHKYIRLDENLGVSGGRNVAIDAAEGDIFVTIDDDARLMSRRATELIVKRFEETPDLGILAFKIVNYYTKTIDRVEFPSRDKSRDPDLPFETAWYIGAGHAIHSKVVREVGAYRDFAPYGSEEYDFALRAIDHGFRIEYYPEIVVEHKRSAEGRPPGHQLLAISLKNRLKAAALNLPWGAFFNHLILRSGQKVVQANGNPIVLLKAYWWLLKDLPYILENRDPISKRALTHIRRLRGGILY